MNCRAKLLSGLDLGAMRGIEIGALSSPMVSKQQSDVLYVDHADQATLREKYRGEAGVNCDEIVPVDAVWGERTMRECLPPGALFDYAFASHVVEHVPDLVGWLGEIAEVLRPGGVLGLVIPDRRFTFDFLRQTSRTSEAVDAYLRRPRRPVPAQIFDFVSNAVALDQHAAWAGTIDPAALVRYSTPEAALADCRRAAEDGAYVDVHCWVFTPASFLKLCAELTWLRLLPFRCRAFHPTAEPDLEFAVLLERLDAGADLSEAAATYREA